MKTTKLKILVFFTLKFKESTFFSLKTLVFHTRCFEILSVETEIDKTPDNSPTASYLQDESYYSTFTDFPDAAPQILHLKRFTYRELNEATNSFSESSKISEGEYGPIYKAVFEDPHINVDLVVKRLKERLVAGQKEWATEVNYVWMGEHPNLVKLVGYCSERDERGLQRLLVYEYMPNRSVEYHLSTRSQIPLLWTMRLNVAPDVARGLAHLYEHNIIFQVFKSSNIFFDNQWNAKISYFDLAWSSFGEDLADVFTKMVKTTGYAAPECSRGRCLRPMCDTWSYGVFLYELITGRAPLDMNRPLNEQKLLEWVKPHVDSKRFELITDTRLNGNYPPKEVHMLSGIANKCLAKNPNSRPNMSKVLKMVNKIIVPTQANCSAPSLKSLVPLIAHKLKNGFIHTNKGRKTIFLPRTHPSKLLKSCFCLGKKDNHAHVGHCIEPSFSHLLTQ